MLQSSFSIIDQLMIGQLGKNSIAAVGLGGNFMLIFSVVFNFFDKLTISRKTDKI